MGTPNIKFARIDNRLVHGQVGNAWAGASHANLIVVVDDEAAEDKMQQAMMKMTADASCIGIRFFSVQKTIDVIFDAAPEQEIFIVCKTPAVMRKLIEAGVPIVEVNIGNMHDNGKKKVFKEPHVYVDDADIADIEAIKGKGVKVYIQMAPADRKIIV